MQYSTIRVSLDESVLEGREERETQGQPEPGPEEQSERLCEDLGTSMRLYWIIKRAARRLRRKAKGALKREKILKEMIDTQSNYQRDLRLLLEEVQRPMTLNSMISEQQSRRIFANLEAIIKLSEELLEKIQKVQAGYNRYSSLLSEPLLFIFPMFILYSEYCNIYYEGDELLKTLRSEFDYIDAFLSEKEIHVLKDTIDSFRIKPIQRVPKYELFLQDYFQTMEEGHPDRVGIDRAISSIKRVNEKNNLSLDQETRKYKSFEFETKFGSKYPILNEKREFKLSVNCSLFGKSIRQAIAHIFSDLVLITDRHVTDVLAYIRLDRHSFVEPASQTKYFRYLVFLAGLDLSAFLLFPSRKEAQQFSESMAGIVQQLKKRTVADGDLALAHAMGVRVLYSEMEYNKFFASEMLTFCVEYILRGFRVRVKYTLDQLTHIFNELKRLGVPELDLSSKEISFYASKKGGSKIIEFQRLMLQVQISNLFKLKDLPSFSREITKTLVVPSSFVGLGQLEVLEGFDYQRERLEMRAAFQEGWKQKRHEGVKPSMSDIINRVYYQHCLAPVLPREGKTELLNIRVHYPTVDRLDSVRLKVRETDSMFQVMGKLAEALNIKFFCDYALYLEVEQCYWRLDYNDHICDIVGEDQKDEEETGFAVFRFIDEGLQKFKEMFTKTPARLFFRRFLFLPLEYELRHVSFNMQEGEQRLCMLVDELYYRFRRGEFLEFAARKVARLAFYLMYLRDYANAKHYSKARFPTELLRKMLPEEMLTSTATLEVWTDRVLAQKDSIITKLHSCQFNPVKLYEQIAGEFESGEAEDRLGYRFVMYEATIGKARDKVLLKINYAQLVLVFERRREEYPIQMVQVSWAPKSLYIFVGQREIRLDIAHPFSVAECISWYKTISKIVTKLEKTKS